MGVSASRAAGGDTKAHERTGRGSETAVVVERLRKVYGDTVAVDDVSFTVPHGEIFGILGPNGAGKTTTVECVIGLRSPDGGAIRVMGLDPRSDRHALRARVGAQLQASALPNRLKVGEIVDLFRSFYRQPADAEEIMDSLGLAAQRGAYYKSLSGGLKQRLSVALALIGNPAIAVLDEMTTGLDPQARRDTWQLVEDVRARGVTILLVTHYMDEAERLCDRVALLDRGRIVALGTPRELADRTSTAKHVSFVASQAFDDALLTGLPEVRAVVHEGTQVVVTGTGDLANAVILTLASVGVTAGDLRLGSASLEDAFVQLTGHHPGEGQTTEARR